MWLVFSIIIFNFIIIIHELGHFIVAKRFGIKVLEFSLFFGPKIFSFTRGDTTYSLRMIPILAYVKLEGEEVDVNNEDSFSNKPLWKRALVIFSGPASNILTALIIYMFIFTIVGYGTTKISQVVKNSPAYNAGISAGDKLLSYDGNNIYQPMDAFLFMYSTKGKAAEVEFLHDGQKKTGTIKPKVIIGDRYLIGFYSSDANGKNSNVIEGFTENSPALSAGLKTGDEIINIDNSRISSYSDISKIMANNKGEEIRVTVSRKNENKTGSTTKTVNIKPINNHADDQYDMGLGFASEKGNFINSIGQSFVNTYDMTRIGIYSIVWLVQGKVPPKDLAGPVGTVAMMSDVANQGESLADKIIGLLSMAALVSIGLGVANLLPIPVADGGKLFLYAIEAIRRKPISKEKEAAINMVGFFLIMLLFVFVMYNDIARLISGG
jgi:regulator of sigma E protease